MKSKVAIKPSSATNVEAQEDIQKSAKEKDKIIKKLQEKIERLTKMLIVRGINPEEDNKTEHISSKGRKEGKSELVIDEKGKTTKRVSIAVASLAEKVLHNFYENEANDKSNEKIRIAISELDPFVIDAKDTIGKYLFGETFSSFMHSIHRFGFILQFLFWIGGSINILCWCSIISPYWLVPGSILVWVIQLNSIFMYNLKKFTLCFWSFEAFILITYSTLGCIFLAISFWDAARAIACVNLLTALLTATFMDCLPNASRKIAAKYLHSCMNPMISLVIAFIYFDVFPNLQQHTFKIGKFESYTTTRLATTCFLNYMFFSLKMVYNGWFHPERYALIQSKVFTCKTHQRITGRKTRLTIFRKKEKASRK